MNSQPLIETRGLTKHFRVGGVFSGRMLHAVDSVNLAIYPREILAIVGESGSGKSTIARLLAGIYRPTAGDILFHGRSMGAGSRADALAYRRRVQMVFQDPYASLNARMTAGDIIAEPWRSHKGLYKSRHHSHRQTPVRHRHVTTRVHPVTPAPRAARGTARRPCEPRSRARTRSP